MIPNSTYVEFDGAGHMPHADDPHRFAEVVLDFAAANPPCTATAESWARLLAAGGPPVGVTVGLAGQDGERLIEQRAADHPA
jgi:hypothetical protein